jgi:hypothetical protein
VVERTFSECKSSALANTLVKDYAGLPSELKAGAIEIEAHMTRAGVKRPPAAILQKMAPPPLKERAIWLEN